MASPDFLKLMKILHEEHYKIKDLKISLNAIPGKPGQFTNKTSMVLMKDDQEIEYESVQNDVALYAFSLKQSLDKDGNYAIMSYKDTGMYYEEINYLMENHKKKVGTAIQKLVGGQFKFSYNHEELLEEFIKSGRRSSLKFEKLKTDYFEIFAFYILWSRDIFRMHQKCESSRPDYKKYHSLIDEILMKAFRQDKNFIKNYLKYSKYIELDFDDFGKRGKEQSDYMKDLFGMLSKRGKVDGKRGVNYILDLYRRFSEICFHFINALRISLEIIGGDDSPKPYKKYVENVRIIKEHPKYSLLVDRIDPNIRHSESHINTEIDEKKGQVILTDKRGGRKVVATYTYKDIELMSKDLIVSLYPALLFSLYLNKIVMIDLLLQSKEYLTMLLAIGNKR